MAPRKTAKHSDSEVVDRAAEAGDMSPPKRKKTVAKTVNKSDEEKQIRLPRAAKSVKTEQSEAADVISAVTKNAKTKAKTSLLAKNVSVLVKTNSKVKNTAKKNKGAAEKTDTSSVNLEIVENPEQTEMKKTRTKAATKKAGIDVDEESKVKSKGKAKKGIADEDIENVEGPIAKRRTPANIETISKGSKAKAVKKKIDTDTDVKDKNANKSTKKAKISNNEIENNVTTKESTVTTKANKKSNDDKATKVTVARKTRGRKNESNLEDILKDDKDLKTEELSSSDPEHTSNNESQEVENNQSETAETTQTSKKGRNVKKKEVPQKRATKMRGKPVNRNADAAFNEDDVVKETQKKINKDSVPTTKRARGKKGYNITGKDENAENTSENLAVEETLSETLSNNNVQKSSDEDNDKKQDSKKDETKYTNVIKNEVNENNVTNTSVLEDEN